MCSFLLLLFGMVFLLGKQQIPTSDWVIFLAEGNGLASTKLGRKCDLDDVLAKTGRAAPGVFVLLGPLRVRWGPTNHHKMEHGDFWSLRGCVPVVGFGRCFWERFQIGDVCTAWNDQMSFVRHLKFFCWDPKGCFIYHSRVTSCNHFTVVTNGMAMKYLIFGDVTINVLIQSRLIYDDIMTPHLFAGRFIHGIFKPTYTINLSILLEVVFTSYMNGMNLGAIMIFN